MLSAFGVDHGEVEKAFWGGPTRAAKKARKAQAAMPRTLPTPPGAKAASALNRAGDADISLKGIGRGVGAGVRRSGELMQKYPGTTGTAVVGGGTAAAYKYASGKQPKKKKKKR